MLKTIETYENMVKEVATKYDIDNFGAIKSTGETIRGNEAYKLMAIQLIKEGFTLPQAKKQLELIINTYYEFL